MNEMRIRLSLHSSKAALTHPSRVLLILGNLSMLLQYKLETYAEKQFLYLTSFHYDIS